MDQLELSADTGFARSQQTYQEALERGCPAIALK
jgi:hypothetical protein